MTLSWVISLSRNVLAITFSSLNNAPFLRTKPILQRLYNIRPSHLPRTCFSQSRFYLAGGQTGRLVRFAVFDGLKDARTAKDSDCQRCQIWCTNERQTQKRPKFISVDDHKNSAPVIWRQRDGWYTVVKLVTYDRQSESPGFLSSFHV